MKIICLMLCAFLLLTLCACQKQPAQMPQEQAPTQMELPAAPAQAARPQTRTEMVNYLQSHTTLGGSLPAFCEATKDEVAEKFQKGTARLARAKTRFPVYLFDAMDRLPDDAFAGDAVWTLSDTPRGNLLLTGPGITLVYNAEEDVVHPPREASVDEALLSTLQTRIDQASFAPGLDRSSPACEALSGYLLKYPDVFQDDGVSVLEDTAWIVRHGEAGGEASLCFLREDPFCGLSQCVITAAQDGSIRLADQRCLDEGWFFPGGEATDLTERLRQIGLSADLAGKAAAFLQEQSQLFTPGENDFEQQRPGQWDILEDAKQAVWLAEFGDDDAIRLMFLLPGDDRYRSVDPEASTLVVRQLFITADGNIQQSPGSVLQTKVNKNPIDRESAVRLNHGAQISLLQSVWDVNPDVWQGFDVVTPCEDSDEIIYPSSWRSYSDGDFMVCIPHEQDFGPMHIHLLTNQNDWFGIYLGMTMEQFWKALDLAGVSHIKYPEQSECLCDGFTLNYQQEDNILTKLWLGGHF